MTTIAVIGSNSFAASIFIDEMLRHEPTCRLLGISRSPEKSALYHPYRAIAGNRFTFHQLDLVSQPQAVAAVLDAARPAVVVNFAALSEVALSNEYPVDYYLANCVGLAHLCDVLRRRDYLRQYLHISTPEVYGSCPYPLEESAPMDPSTPYAASKGGGDLLLRALFKTFGFPAMLLRATNFYGLHQQLYKLIPLTVIRLRRGERLALHGGGKAVKTWLHARDFARGVMRCIEVGRAGEIYHFSDENAIAVADVVRLVCRLMGQSFEACTTVVNERVGQDARYVLDYSKAKRELGWEPHEPFEDGLREVVEWIEKNWDEVSAEPHSYRHLSSAPA